MCALLHKLLTAFALGSVVGAEEEGCFKPSSLCHRRRADEPIAITTLAAPRGGNLALDCEFPDECKRTDRDGCFYFVRWHRFAGCNNSIVVSDSNRFKIESKTLTIYKANENDRGLWACEFGAEDVSAIDDESSSASTQIHHLYNVELERSPSTCVLMGELSAEQANQCSKQAFGCFKSVTYDNPAGEPTRFVRAGCAPYDSLPRRLFEQLAGRENAVCQLFQNSRSCTSATSVSSTPYSTLCCYCFADGCNVAKISGEQLAWDYEKANNKPWHSATCRELDRLQTSAATILTYRLLFTCFLLTFLVFF